MLTELKVNLLEVEDLSAAIKALCEVEQELDLMLSEYQPDDLRAEIEDTLRCCNPLNLLDGLSACLTSPNGVIEVCPDMRSIGLEQEFLKCETTDWLIDSWAGRVNEKIGDQSHPWLRNEKLSHVPRQLFLCYESVYSSYFSLFGIDGDRRGVWNFWSQSIFNASRQDSASSADRDLWEEMKKSYFYSAAERHKFLSNLLSAIRNPSSGNRNEYVESPGEVGGGCGFVYFVRNGDLHKIGITENLLRRMNEISPDEVLNVVRCYNYRELERDLHQRFKDVRLPQTEYFRLRTDQVTLVHQLLIEKAKF